jgi:hypothetical protein
MTEKTRIDELLDDFVAPFEPAIDGWADVLSRARRTRRRYALGVAVAVAAIAVPSAVAFGDDIENLFRGTPAPPPVSSSFESNNRMADMATQNGFRDQFPHADVSQAHGVIEIQTPDGPEDVWAAPTDRGGKCWWVDFANDAPVNGSQSGYGVCDTPENNGSIATGMTWQEAHASLSTLFGLVRVQADRVVVQLKSGSTRTLPVVEGAFIASFDRSDVDQLDRVTAYDGDDQVGTWESPNR